MHDIWENSAIFYLSVSSLFRREIDDVAVWSLKIIYTLQTCICMLKTDDVTEWYITHTAVTFYAVIHNIQALLWVDGRPLRVRPHFNRDPLWYLCQHFSSFSYIQGYMISIWHFQLLVWYWCSLIWVAVVVYQNNDEKLGSTWRLKW